jgi:RNA polymerase sigma factor (sigma-70 family)
MRHRDFSMLEYSVRDGGSAVREETGAVGCDPVVHERNARRVLDGLFRRERSALIRYIQRRVGLEAAGDLVQDVFLRAATSPQINDLYNARAFLRRVADNAIIDRARRNKCRIATLPLAEANEASCVATQEQEHAADDLQAALERALAGLPERTRAIFIMHRFDEKAYRDIHHELGISIATVEYHMMRALAHIRAALVDRSGER